MGSVQTNMPMLPDREIDLMRADGATGCIAGKCYPCGLHTSAIMTKAQKVNNVVPFVCAFKNANKFYVNIQTGYRF